MVFKTPKAFAVGSSNNVLNLLAIPAHHTSITSPPRPRPPPSTPPLKQTTSRCYASVNHNYPPNDSVKPPNGPGKPGGPSWPACANPTPYDIFDIEKTAPYTKSRFAELVKQYHPDKHHASALDSLPSHTRLERYRLIVLANEILSSPEKRRAYDAFGAHWQTPDTAADDPRDIHEVYRHADKAWRRTAGNPSANATWEDWERWHHRRANPGSDRQAPLYMSNASFAALVIAALAVGTVAQTTRMENSSAHILERKDAHEAHIAEALRRRGEATAGKGREERIERFLRERENINFGFMPAKLDVRPAPSAK
ncbi:DnaJ domain-containing protein [Colletotrichum eremochloae]|nr:DnaJ domain-containing protein [Colletotrichum eremochloae]